MKLTSTMMLTVVINTVPYVNTVIILLVVVIKLFDPVATLLI